MSAHTTDTLVLDTTDVTTDNATEQHDTVSAETAASFVVARAVAEDVATTAVETARRAFIDSATNLALAARTIPASHLAAAITEAAIEEGLFTRDANGKVTKPKRWAGLVYSSNAAVGYHARTGEFLLLPAVDADGNPAGLPDGVTPQDVQTLVKHKSINTTTVDNILSAAATQADAYAALFDAVEQGKAAQAAAGDVDTDDEDADEDKDEKVKDALHYLTAVEKVIAKVVGMDETMWSTEAELLAEGIAQSLGGRLADLLATRATRAALANATSEDADAA